MGLLTLYTLTIFLGAFLLFLVQPMAAKGVLPVLGGAPAVWNTCMVFFQAALLAGYAYAHGLLRIRRTWVGVAIHAALVLGALAVLPLSVRSAGAGFDPTRPVWWLLGTLSISVGLPFLALSATGPLVQGWFSRSGHRSAGDPYFLYAASNAGSMLALLAYPLAVEPLLTLQGQGLAWSAAYLAFAAAILACGVVAARGLASATTAHPSASSPPEPESISWASRARWVALAFIPSSLMLGVTQHISTDIAPVPLLWIVPLSIYLLSFIIVFSGRGPRRGQPWGRRWSLLLTVLVVALGVAFLRGARQPAGLLIGLHLAALLAASMVCHGRLAADRPGTARLTEFYLWIAIGGVLGGLFNAVIAPSIFLWVAEYPLVLALACLARLPRAQSTSASAPPPSLPPTPPKPRGRKTRPQGPPDADAEPAPDDHSWRSAWALVWTGRSTIGGIALDLLWPLWIPVLYIWTTRMLAPAAVATANWLGVEYTPDRAEFLGDTLPLYLGVGIPALLCYLFSRRNLRLAVALIALFATGYYLRPLSSHLLMRDRTFFGVYRVESYRVIPAGAPPADESSIEVYHSLSHGTTQHGLQNMSDGRRTVPLVYYHPEGPVGQLIRAMGDDPRLASVGLVGLGTGAMAAYGEPGRTFTFYEIDPAIVSIASDPRLFTYLQDSRAEIQMKIGDGRLLLAGEPDSAFGLIVLDAFSSDAVPIHLLTVEAIRLYLDKLQPDGLLAFHISNRHLSLSPVVAAAAQALGVPGLRQEDLVLDEEDSGGRVSSTWIILAKDAAALGPISRDGRWSPLRARDGFRPWTDDYSNVWAIFNWN
jgi:hypothetical protein